MDLIDFRFTRHEVAMLVFRSRFISIDDRLPCWRLLIGQGVNFNEYRDDLPSIRRIEHYPRRGKRISESWEITHQSVIKFCLCFSLFFCIQWKYDAYFRISYFKNHRLRHLRKLILRERERESGFLEHHLTRRKYHVLLKIEIQRLVSALRRR